MHDSSHAYDAGYGSCPCFWGREPASLLKMVIGSLKPLPDARALDVGCGEGKNAHALAAIGYTVDAVDCSALAINNGKKSFSHDLIRWHLRNALDFHFHPESYDVVVAYGIFHCLDSGDELQSLISKLKDSTKPGGINLVCAFNNGPHDLSAHPGFTPLLLPHSTYVDHYCDWRVMHATDTTLHETHPHNNIPHFHSLTRLIASKPYGARMPA
ncbi:class I SAM-dependent methyltransferase [Bradyrhizobium sp. WBAH33]|nr:class I SAM-dependent methyltransferase [Bradyrhizobium sp. WBAH33]QCK02415.1 class I SAM-dependent methyltransferase [Bradyrhizobium sp. WBAH41]